MGAEAGPVPSPCVNVCVLAPGGRLCTACGRTIEEIVGWSRLDDAARRAVLERIGRDG